MTEREKKLIASEKKWEIEKNLQERELKLRKEKRKMGRQKYIPQISTSKLLILFLFINCTAIELFTGYITIGSIQLAYAVGCMPDFAPLITLIGAVVSEVIGFAIYSLKSARENCAGGITYETAMASLSAEHTDEAAG